jgi:hypothetical protein
MVMSKQWHLIGRGFAGWHSTGIDVSSSGGRLGDYTYWTGKRCDGYLKHAVEGCLVYDAKAADHASFRRLIISGPIVEPKLTVDEGTGGFSYCTVDTFERLLRAIPGVRLWRVRGGKLRRI